MIQGVSTRYYKPEENVFQVFIFMSHRNNF